MSEMRYLPRCPFCFARDACSVRFARTGKPYLACTVCMSRAFLNRREALRGVAVAPTLIDLALTDHAPWIDTAIHELTSWVRATAQGKGLPEATPEAQPWIPPVALADGEGAA